MQQNYDSCVNFCWIYIYIVKMSVNSDPQVTKRLFAILVLMIGLMCVFGGYLLGRNAGNEGKRNTDLLTYNLTISADNLYKKAKRILPKSIHHNDSDKVRAKLIEIFNCTCCKCPLIDKYNLAEFIKYSINFEVLRVMKAVHNASSYLDLLQ